MNKLTEREQQEILDYISWTCGNKPEPDWRNMPSWLVKLHNAQQSVQRIAFGAFSAGVLVGIVIALIVVFYQIGVR